MTSSGPRANAVVLFSAGLDSTTVLAQTVAEGRRPLPLTFVYGQTHASEVDWARRLVESFGLEEHLVLPLPFDDVGGSALLGEGEIPDAPPEGNRAGIPPTYVPARNTVFLSLALAVAEARGIRDLYLGINAIDYSGYPDCRPAFVEAFERLANLATREGVEHDEAWFRIHAPLSDLPKSRIIQRGVSLGVDYSLTVSCYRADSRGHACGRCDSCELRRQAFHEAEIADPTRYKTHG